MRVFTSQYSLAVRDHSSNDAYWTLCDLYAAPYPNSSRLSAQSLGRRFEPVPGSHLFSSTYAHVTRPSWLIMRSTVTGSAIRASGAGTPYTSPSANFRHRHFRCHSRSEVDSGCGGGVLFKAWLPSNLNKTLLILAFSYILQS